MSQKLDDIRRVCVAANPDVWLRTNVENQKTIPLRLADILFAIDHNEDNPPAVTAEGQFCQYNPEDGSMYLSGEFWNLRKDDLTQQSEETIDFIHSLLKV